MQVTSKSNPGRRRSRPRVDKAQWIISVLALLGAPVGFANPLEPLIKAINNEVDAKRAMETVNRVYATDRWFTFPKFEETALYLKRRLEESGVKNVEIGGARADGKTQAGYWTMPLAWDANQATLEVIKPERILLCDYQQIPSSLGMWSGSTPKEGVTAELVDITKTPWAEVKGKIVLTGKKSDGLKYQLVKYGALGAVNGFSENPALEDGRQWINAWGDNGWGFTKASTPLLSYSVTPRQAKRLRQILATGKKVMVRAVADTRYYEGRYPWVTGVIPGVSSGEEVLVLGHTSEQGAQDNATGVSAMVEALHTISRLIETGKLSRPARSIRILLMPEVYGSLSYISENPARMKHTVAAMTVDTPAAAYDMAGTAYTFYLNPHVAMSYTDALIQRIAKSYYRPSRPWHWGEYITGTDTYLSEPTVGVPTVWPYSGTGVHTHHNSEDKPETVDVHSLHDLTVLVASYLYFNATAGEPQVRWLAEITLDHTLQQMQSTAAAALDGLLSGNASAGAYGLQRIQYLGDRGGQAALTALRVVPQNRTEEASRSLEPMLSQIREFQNLQMARLRSAGAKDVPSARSPEAEKIVVRRNRPGTLPMDDLPQDQWRGYPSGAWDKLVTMALYWCDGKRNLADVIHLTKMETGPTDFDFIGYFRFLHDHGYVDFAE
jgi:hypothetical protein